MKANRTQWELYYILILYSLLLLVYKTLQQATVMNTVGNCTTMGIIIKLYCNVLLFLGYKPMQHNSVPNIVVIFNIVVNNIILYCSII